MNNLEIFTNSVVWVNFIAKTKAKNYISGHDEKGKEFVLSSDGTLFKHVNYSSGSLFLKENENSQTSSENMIQLYEIIAFDNEDTSKPAPSKSIKDRLEDFYKL